MKLNIFAKVPCTHAHNGSATFRNQIHWLGHWQRKTWTLFHCDSHLANWNRLDNFKNTLKFMSFELYEHWAHCIVWTVKLNRSSSKWMRCVRMFVYVCISYHSMHVLFMFNNKNVSQNSFVQNGMNTTHTHNSIADIHIQNVAHNQAIRTTIHNSWQFIAVIKQLQQHSKQASQPKYFFPVLFPALIFVCGGYVCVNAYN